MTESLLRLSRPDRVDRGDADSRDLALQSRRTLGLTDLLRRRPELRGVSTWSEDVAESVLWSA